MALLFALSGCAPGPVAIKKSDFLLQANDICQKETTSQQTLPDPGRDFTAMSQDVDNSINFTQQALVQLRNVAQPRQDATTIASIFAKFDKVLADLQQESTALHNSDINSVRSIYSTLQGDVNDANAAASAYGLTSCTGL